MTVQNGNANAKDIGIDDLEYFARVESGILSRHRDDEVREARAHISNVNVAPAEPIVSILMENTGTMPTSPTELIQSGPVSCQIPSLNDNFSEESPSRSSHDETTEQLEISVQAEGQLNLTLDANDISPLHLDDGDLLLYEENEQELLPYAKELRVLLGDLTLGDELENINILRDLPNESDEATTRDYLLREVDVDGAVSKSIRAHQVATELARQFDWPDSGLEILTRIFEKYGWNSCRRAVQRLMLAGMEPEELELAELCRDLWREYPEYSTDVSGSENGALSWSLALSISRAFRNIPDIAQIERFLAEAFDEWWNSSSLQNRYFSFSLFLTDFCENSMLHSFAAPEAMLVGVCDQEIGDYIAGGGLGFNTPLYQDLERLNLLPTDWTDYFTEKVFELQKEDDNG